MPPREPREALALQLAIGRDGIGLELSAPTPLGCLLVTELAANLPGLRFPLDVSGGVPRFRHRRGELRRLEVEVGARALERYAAPRLRGIVGTGVPGVSIAPGPDGASVCLTAQPEPDADPTALAAVLAFEVAVVAEDADLVLIVSQARGAGLGASPVALALAAVGALLSGLGDAAGSEFLLRAPATTIARRLLPDAGARVPATEDVRWASITPQGDTWLLHALPGVVAAAPSGPALRGREAAAMLREVDEALVSGDEVLARSLALDVLERAPRHPEVLRRIAQIDARAPGRAEAALSLLAVGDAAGPMGTLPGELRIQTGDVDGALASLEQAGETEAAGPLAARALELAASVTRDAVQAAAWLDRAVARAPRSATARWARAERRVELGRLEDALADIEHLEAMARSGPARHRVWLRAGRTWSAAGLTSRAGALFERALAFVPDEPAAMGGLAAALIGDGKQARGVALLARARELAESRGEAAPGLVLDLARALADSLEDLPAAIAHASSVPVDAAEAPLARGLEGRWRARLGDLAGASLAFARLRELAGSIDTTDARARTLAGLLREGAAMAGTELREPLAAQRLLAAALRLCPRDPALLREYRQVGEALAHPERSPVPAEREDDGSAPSDAGSAPPSAPRSAPAARRVDLGLEADAAPESAQAAARAEELTRRLQAAPGDDAVADELLEVLEQLGRGLELLALISARLEDATSERRAVLAPRAREALLRVAREAEAHGKADEAALYRGAVDALVPGPDPA